MLSGCNIMLAGDVHLVLVGESFCPPPYHSDHIPVRQHVYPCTPGNLESPLTQKTISTMFYVEVECTAVSVVHVMKKSVITKCVCV